MVTASVQAYGVLLAALALERGVELAVSARNRRRALARGGREYGRGEFRVMAAVHALFLPACAAEVLLLQRAWPGPVIGGAALAGVLAAQVLRYWCVATLGERWNVRVVVVPGKPPITGGPYRFLRHPNYLAVIVEMACVPLVHGAWLTAVAFSALNAALLRQRISTEEAALGDEYRRAFAGRPRLVPGGER
ncbi:MAG: hypothetical protein HY901_28390 [Deltaproteobacteria bacterium]|nr:hypothetical protein [Deltaproteobacteria bacterium]